MKTVKFAPAKSQEYKAILGALLSQTNAKDEGFTIDQVRTAIKAMDKIEAAGDDVAFEDTEYAYVAERVKGARFTVASRDVVEFVDAVLNAS
jgi:hypothetical protein